MEKQSFRDCKKEMLSMRNNWIDRKYGKEYYNSKKSGISHNITMQEVLIMEAMKDYVAHLDNKKRITLRGAAYQYYNVKEYGNGCIILEPRELAVPESISTKTLEDMDRAISNFKKGDVSPAIDLSDF